MLFTTLVACLPSIMLALAGPLPHDARQVTSSVTAVPVHSRLPHSIPPEVASLHSEIKSYMSKGSFPPGFASSVRAELGPQISSLRASRTLSARQDDPTPTRSVPPETASLHSEIKSYMSVGSFLPGFASSVRAEFGPRISSFRASHTLSARQDLISTHSVPPEVASLHSEIKSLMSEGPIPSDVASSIREEIKDQRSSAGGARPSRSIGGGVKSSHVVSARQEPSASVTAPAHSRSGVALSALPSMRSEIKSVMPELVDFGVIPSGMAASLFKV